MGIWNVLNLLEDQWLPNLSNEFRRLMVGGETTSVGYSFYSELLLRAESAVKCWVGCPASFQRIWECGRFVSLPHHL